VLGSAHVAAFLARVPTSDGEEIVQIVTSLPERMIPGPGSVANGSGDGDSNAEFEVEALVKCTGVLVDGDMVVVVVPSSHKISLKQVATYYSVGTNHRILYVHTHTPPAG